MVQEADSRLSELIRQIGQPDRVIRYVAVKELGQLHDPRSVTPLISLLKEEVDYLYEDDEDIWLATLDALERIGEPSVVPLVELVDDLENDQEIRINAIDVIADIGDSRATPSLIRWLNDEDSVVRYTVVYGLGKLRGEQVVEPLITALSDEDEDVRYAAAEVLGELGDARAIPALRHRSLSDTSRDVRDTAAMALELISRPQQ